MEGVGSERERREGEREIHVVDRGSIIATINTSSAGLLSQSCIGTLLCILYR